MSTQFATVQTSVDAAAHPVMPGINVQNKVPQNGLRNENNNAGDLIGFVAAPLMY